MWRRERTEFEVLLGVGFALVIAVPVTLTVIFSCEMLPGEIFRKD